MNPAKFKVHLLEAIIAGLIAALIIIPFYIFTKLEEIQSRLIDPSDYFVVNNVHVEDAVRGGDPTVIYDRIVVRTFRGRWIAGVFSLPEQQGAEAYGVCNNSGEVEYKPSVKLPITGVTLSWFIEKDCKLEPGKYVLRTVWELLFPEGVVKRVRFTSNVFTISEGIDQ